MEHVLFNLINNALDHTPDDGDVIVELEKIEDKLRISISDSGSDVSAEEIDSIFERY